MTTVGARHFGRHGDENGSFIVAEFYYYISIDTSIYGISSLYAEVIFTKLSNVAIGEIRRLGSYLGKQ